MADLDPRIEIVDEISYVDIVEDKTTVEIVDEIAYVEIVEDITTIEIVDEITSIVELATQGPPGVTGATGPKGEGLTIVDTLESINDLPNPGIPSEAYLIDQDLWVWVDDSWTNAGKITGPTGATGVIGLPGATGPQGIRGASGSTGLTGSTGPRGIQGASGSTGLMGSIGLTGATGSTGPQGLNGGNSQPYRYSTTTTDADPGTGYLRFNNSTHSSATLLYVDLLNINSVDLTAWLDSLDDLGSTLSTLL
jgi:hypothetical protein